MNYSEYRDSIKSSGKTQRMIEAAIAAVNQGIPACIIVDTMEEKVNFKRYIEQELGVRICVEPGSKFDWNYMRCRGLSNATKYFIDTKAIESRFGELLEKYMEFNPTQE